MQEIIELRPITLNLGLGLLEVKKLVGRVNRVIVLFGKLKNNSISFRLLFNEEKAILLCSRPPFKE